MRIIIIDDDKMITYALKTILETQEDMEIVGIGHSCDQAVELFDTFKPDIALMDIRMGDKTGIDALRIIGEKHLSPKIIFLTTFHDDEYIKEAIKLGSKGYILKDEFENIIPAIRAVHAGQTVYGNNIVEELPRILQHEEHEGLSEELTDKEIEILQKLSQGLNNKEIAQQLYLSEGTIRNYISLILEKLQLRDRTQLAIYYLTMGSGFKKFK